MDNKLRHTPCSVIKLTLYSLRITTCYQSCTTRILYHQAQGASIVLSTVLSSLVHPANDGPATLQLAWRGYTAIGPLWEHGQTLVPLGRDQSLPMPHGDDAVRRRSHSCTRSRAKRCRNFGYVRPMLVRNAFSQRRGRIGS